MQTGIPGDGQGLACVDWRLTGGISPVALSLAYTDWTQHLIASPDKQLELRAYEVGPERRFGLRAAEIADIDRPRPVTPVEGVHGPHQTKLAIRIVRFKLRIPAGQAASTAMARGGCLDRALRRPARRA